LRGEYSRRFARVGPFVAICLMAWVRDSKNGISYRSLKTSEGLPGRLPVAIVARLLCSIMNAGSGDFRTPVTHDQKGFRLAKALANVASSDFVAHPTHPKNELRAAEWNHSRSLYAIQLGQISL
jgi:hypothetical protein